MRQIVLPQILCAQCVVRVPGQRQEGWPSRKIFKSNTSLFSWEAFGFIVPQRQFIRPDGARSAMQDLSRQPADPLIGTAGDDHKTHRFQNAGRHAHCPRKNRDVPKKAAVDHLVASRLVGVAYGGAQLFREHLQQHTFSRSRRGTQKNDTGGFAGDMTAKAGSGQKHHSRGIRDLSTKTYTNLPKNYTF
nr:MULTISPECIES: hypothetical protein [Agrobacterium]